MSQKQVDDLCSQIFSYYGSYAYQIQSALWGAEQLLMENSDNTISEVELRARVAQMILLANDKVMQLQDLLDQVGCAFGGPSPEERLEKLLRQAQGAD